MRIKLVGGPRGSGRTSELIEWAKAEERGGPSRYIVSASQREGHEMFRRVIVEARAADEARPTAEPDLTTVEGWNEVARRWLADGPPPGWRGHTDRLEVANPVARWLSLDPELVRLAARVGGALAAEQATAKPTRLKKAVTADG